jgi:hypothetical protein
MKMGNNYHLTMVWNGDKFERDIIAFDFGITHPKCLTIFYVTGGSLIIDETGIEAVEITPLRR